MFAGEELFLCRNITNRGDRYEVSLADNYTTTLVEEVGPSNSNPTIAPGTSARKTLSADSEQHLSTEEQAQYRLAVGKLQWMTYARPDISHATKELARSFAAPAEGDQQKLKRLLRYVNGAKRCKQIIRPTAAARRRGRMTNNTENELRAFVARIFNTVTSYGSRTQATIAFSSAEAEVYAVNTGATEALRVRALLLELVNRRKINVKIHTGSSGGKSMATRIGYSKKARRIDIRRFFLQQPVACDIVRIPQFHTDSNPADIFTKYVSTDTLH